MIFVLTCIWPGSKAVGGKHPDYPKDLAGQVDKVTRECESQPDDEIAQEVLKAFPDLSRPSIYGFSNLEENNHHDLCNTKFMLIMALCCTIILRPN